MKILIILLCTLTLSHAKLTVASLFTDHMVLQRDLDVPVWGWAEAGSKVKVTFSGQTKTTKTNAQGEWRVNLAPMTANKRGETLTISGKNTLKFRNVVVGEVWICSGQSNMQFEMKRAPGVTEMIPAAGDIRSFSVPRTVAYTEQKNVNSTWKKEVPNSAVAASFALFLEKNIDIPVGIILSCWGSSSLEAWMPADLASQLPDFKDQLTYQENDIAGRERIEKALASKKRTTPDDIFMRRQPNILWNAMIKPLAPYACRGLIWYQGERNAFNYGTLPKQPWYRRTIPVIRYGNALNLWMQRYRKEWQRDDFHFMIVMLPGYAKNVVSKPQNPATRSYAWMREAQLSALDLPNTSVTNTIDLGHLTNIHPNDKLPIGERLALLARRDTLGQDIIAEGPIFKSATPRGKSITLTFTNAAGLTTKDGKAPHAFWVTDKTQKWHPATAQIEGETITLTCSEIKNPLYVRYAFSGFPEPNLINDQKLPARPFRSDTFKK